MNTEAPAGHHTLSGRWFLPAIGALGFACVATQLVLMRELLCALTGNELVLGMVLGNWLLLMGVGAWLGRRTDQWRRPLDAWIAGQVLLALVPLAQVCAVRLWRNEIFVRGAAIGVSETFISSLLVLLPFCVVAGFLLSLACSLCAQAGDTAGRGGRVYVADSIGSIGGGVVFGLALVWVVDSFALLALAGCLNLACAAMLAKKYRRRLLLAAAVAGGALLALVMFVLQPDAYTAARQHPGEELLFRGNSPYGQLVVTRAGDQLNFFQNGLPIAATHNIEQVEETVHYAMAQRPEARQVLLIGGGFAGTARELRKYRAHVTYVELDPLLLEVGRRFLPENLAEDARFRVINADGRRLIQGAHAAFDVILVDLADPATAQLNRFHTAEFLTAARRALTTNGVLALAVGRYENAVSPELARILATQYHTLRGAFAHVVMIPGGRVFFLASDGALDLDVATRLERAQLSTRFVRRAYLDAMLTPDRLADLQRAVRADAATNRDFSPVLYFQCLRQWSVQFETRFRWLLLALGAAMLAYVVSLRGAAAVVFASGFTASALEVVLLLGFQALCGSLYYQLGVIVTIFMAGLAIGAALANRACARNWLWPLTLGLAAMAVLLPGALRLLGAAPQAAPIAIGVLTLALAAVTGAIFAAANRAAGAQASGAAARLYTADFVGASLGALLASAWLIPLLGVTRLCWLAAILNLLAAVQRGLRTR